MRSTRLDPRRRHGLTGAPLGKILFPGGPDDLLQVWSPPPTVQGRCTHRDPDGLVLRGQGLDGHGLGRIPTA